MIWLRLRKRFARGRTESEFQARIERLGLPRSEVAARLGLSIHGLNHQLYGVRAVSRQTELLLDHLEREQARREKRRHRQA